MRFWLAGDALPAEWHIACRRELLPNRKHLMTVRCKDGLQKIPSFPRSQRLQAGGGRSLPSAAVYSFAISTMQEGFGVFKNGCWRTKAQRARPSVRTRPPCECVVHLLHIRGILCMICMGRAMGSHAVSWGQVPTVLLMWVGLRRTVADCLQQDTWENPL